ncbi:MAG: hypothetical protein DRJ18_01965 [Candidatus Methanomethylicota archaeon]|nr:MAG: hypothetical protein DRJ18_01965 [Candidatus Verstraetearchaeota archaeon]
MFNPHYCPDYDVVYLDIKPPDFECSRCYWIVADAQNLPLRNDAIDEMYAAHVIEHLEDPLRFLRECRRVLKRGGMVTIETPNFLSRNAYLDPDHKHTFNLIRLWRMIKKVGLKPHTPTLVGTLLPHKLRVIFKIFILLLSDTLIVLGEKHEGSCGTPFMEQSRWRRTS